MSGGGWDFLVCQACGDDEATQHLCLDCLGDHPEAPELAALLAERERERADLGLLPLDTYTAQEGTYD